MIELLKSTVKKHENTFLFFKRCLLYIRFIVSFFLKDKYGDLTKTFCKDVFEISALGYHCYFGYYDKSPVNISGKYVAYIRVKKESQLGEKVDVCIYDINKKETKVLSKTNAWNWQQGCMLQWIDNNHLSFNIYNTEKNKYQTVIINIYSKGVTFYNRSAYAYNSNNSTFLSLNFFRLNTFAKGYGYPFSYDSMNINNDGIWETSLDTNKSKLILSLNRIINYSPLYDVNCQHYVNHVTYCPDENKIMFIHRWQKPGTNFTSRLLIYNFATDKLETILDSGHVSHFCWKSDTELLIYATNSDKNKGYMIVDIINKKTRMIKGLPNEDGHPSYSNNKKQIITDTYPNHRRVQHLFVFDIEKQQLRLLDKLKSPFKYFNDERCDLHPRWSFDNNYIVIDNTNSGHRALKVYKIK